MRPRLLEELPADELQQHLSAVERLKRAMQRKKVSGTILEPEKAEEPILAPPVRAALFSWLAEIRAADALMAVGVAPRSLALLHGPPGCGKTTLAHHLAARLGIPMLVVGPEDIQGKYLGESEGNTARLFDVIATAEAPCVLFLDEFESIATHRSKLGGSSADNGRASAVTVLLRKLEECRAFVVGATNRPDDIDPAAWRRFHIHLPIELPGADDRFAILRRYGLPFQFDDDALDLLVTGTLGASPALLRGLMEGIKRALVVGPRINQDVLDPVRVIRRVITAVQPPPAMELPPLWSGGSALSALSAMAWPPTLEPTGDGA